MKPYRWMRPLADAAAAAAADNYATCGGTPIAGSDENASAAANVGLMMPDRACAKQAKLLCSVQPFLKAVANAAALAKVQILPETFRQTLGSLGIQCY